MLSLDYAGGRRRAERSVPTASLCICICTPFSLLSVNGMPCAFPCGSRKHYPDVWRIFMEQQHCRSSLLSRDHLVLQGFSKQRGRLSYPPELNWPVHQNTHPPGSWSCIVLAEAPHSATKLRRYPATMMSNTPIVASSWRNKWLSVPSHWSLTPGGDSMS